MAGHSKYTIVFNKIQSLVIIITAINHNKKHSYNTREVFWNFVRLLSY
jgi:hypothetical protein